MKETGVFIAVKDCYQSFQFYLQDTKSSNGTFVNSQRLSKGSEESVPRQLYSGDIIQFGVDVMENSRRATVQLYHPDGREATNDHSSPFLTSGGAFGAQSQELFQIAQYLQEALHREQMLENKLATLQRLVQQTQEASDSGWQALIDEDRLLSRLEVLENQLAAYSKNQTEDTLRQELTHLQEDKYNYETRAKESLHKVLQEKFDAVRKLSDLERSLSNTEDECSHLREMCEASQQELQALAEKHAEKLKEFSALQNELQEAEKKHNDTLEAAEQEKAELQRQLDELNEETHHLQAKVEALQANNDFKKGTADQPEG
ncbi:hypothetical protein LSH36_30g03031 [Paralvinella palmiformis]|uniref:FHA domain-containing protein n=1 Tax=Paralvinella palmiformis TaxID=53620 RepID=A0AAD9K937_9ANNE|nr:hypothetical protein LSH36_30g03031 [Paralvinella palmiformis]